MMIDKELLDELCVEAGSSPRRRKNRNFHSSEISVCHRLLNAVEPDSYIQPHRHLDSGKEESILAVRGRFGILLFNENGEIHRKCIIAPDSEIVGVNIPTGQYHSLVALESNSVFFEAKAGPYVPISEKEKAPWAPQENDADAALYLKKMKENF